MWYRVTVCERHAGEVWVEASSENEAEAKAPMQVKTDFICVEETKVFETSPTKPLCV